MRNIAVVLLRGCWLDGTNKCLKNGAAEVETLFFGCPAPTKMYSNNMAFLRFVPAPLISATPSPG